MAETIKHPLADGVLRAALWAEKALTTRIGSRRTPRAIEAYAGYATPEGIIVQGRIHDTIRQTEVEFGQGRLSNLRQMIGLFLTSEVADAEVTAQGVTARSDEEGYFRLTLPRPDATGRVEIPVTLAATGEATDCPVYIPAKGDAPLVISDIDDTVMHTGAYSLVRNLWTSLSGNALTRRVFPDSAVLLHKLHDDAGCPVFFVSSSPWNLYQFLTDVFARNDVIPGPMFLRDLGLDTGKLITAGHGNHKGRAIDTILEANPGRRAILIGDTGQKDASIYRGASERHAGRIAAVILRTPATSLDDKDRAEIAALRDSGATVLHGRSFAGFWEQLVPAIRSNQDNT